MLDKQLTANPTLLEPSLWKSNVSYSRQVRKCGLEVCIQIQHTHIDERMNSEARQVHSLSTFHLGKTQKSFPICFNYIDTEI